MEVTVNVNCPGFLQCISQRRIDRFRCHLPKTHFIRSLLEDEFDIPAVAADADVPYSREPPWSSTTAKERLKGEEHIWRRSHI